jgi:hypothetical protein
VGCLNGQIPLQDMRVDFQVEAVARPDTRGFGVRKTVTFERPTFGNGVTPPAAAAGAINAWLAARGVVLHGALGALPDQGIAAALQQDPLYTSFRKGVGLLDEQIVVM